MKDHTHGVKLIREDFIEAGNMPKLKKEQLELAKKLCDKKNIDSFFIIGMNTEDGTSSVINLLRGKPALIQLAITFNDAFAELYKSVDRHDFQVDNK